MSFTLAQPNSGRVWKCNCERPARSQLVTPASQQPKPADTCLIRSVVPCELDWFSKSRRRRVQVPALALSNNASLCKSSYVQMYQSPRSSSSLQAGNFVGLMGQILQQLTATVPQGAALTVDSVRYHPAGSPVPLLDSISLQLPANKLGLIFGRSGAGKTTLLQLLAGLTVPTSGTVTLGADTLTPRELAMRCGLVFQFPERYFLGGTLQEELTFGWPTYEHERQAYAVQTRRVLAAVGLNSFPLDIPLQHLSGGYKRRAALAVQLIRRPGVLLLDEPLAGLDWRARAELAETLRQLKSECTILVVSHDLRELTPLVDHAWQLHPGGTLKTAQWPPTESAASAS